MSARKNERSEPTPIDAWINGNRLAWWCRRCDMWHGNGFDPDEAEPILRHAPHCWGDSADSIRLVVQGRADSAMRTRMKREDPPRGIPHPGPWVLPETVNRAVFLQQARLVEQLILRGAPSAAVADACKLGFALLKAWLTVSDDGLNMVRRPRLMAVARKIHGEPVGEIEEYFCLTPAHECSHIHSRIRSIIDNIHELDSSWRSCRQIGWAYQSCVAALGDTMAKGRAPL
jgi:hypothetical protein